MSKTKQKVNPDIEFQSDPMLKELHKVRIEMYNDTKDMPLNKLIAYYKEKSDKFLK